MIQFWETVTIFVKNGSKTYLKQQNKLRIIKCENKFLLITLNCLIYI